MANAGEVPYINAIFPVGQVRHLYEF